MAKTVDQIRAQISKLQAQEHALLQKEISGVVAKIKVAVEHYGLTPEHIFGSSVAGKPAARAAAESRNAIGRGAKISRLKGNGVSVDRATTKRVSAAKGTKVAAKYKDDAGNVWSGRGSQPRWLRAALEAGKKLEDFTVA